MNTTYLQIPAMTGNKTFKRAFNPHYIRSINTVCITQKVVEASGKIGCKDSEQFKAQL